MIIVSYYGIGKEFYIKHFNTIYGKYNKFINLQLIDEKILTNPILQDIYTNMAINLSNQNCIVFLYSDNNFVLDKIVNILIKAEYGTTLNNLAIIIPDRDKTAFTSYSHIKKIVLENYKENPNEINHFEYKSMFLNYRHYLEYIKKLSTLNPEISIFDFTYKDKPEEFVINVIETMKEKESERV